MSLVALAVLVAGVPRAHAQEVNGIYTEAATKDLGDITKIDAFKNVKFRGWVDSYYVYNFNRMNRELSNQNQDKSVVKSRDLTIEGRTFDIHHNSFTADLAEIEVEKVPERGGVGFKVDLAFGDIQDVIVDTIKSAHGIHSASDFDRNFQHASVSYLAPVGSGLRFDFGKFVTHIGGETIASIKNRNFSHAFFYTYAIPFQDSGLRVNYAFNSKVYGELYLLNGWNVTSDNNTAKTIGGSFGITPNAKLSVYANYLGGAEHTDSNDDWRHLGDFQIIYLPTAKLQTMVNIDIGIDKNGLGPGADATWGGVTAYVRPNVKDRFFPTLRAEYYNDSDGFTTGVAQKLWGVTFTGDCRVGPADGFAKVLVRPEFRYDKSDERFFSHENSFRSRDYQATVGIGLVAYF